MLNHLDEAQHKHSVLTRDGEDGLTATRHHEIRKVRKRPLRYLGRSSLRACSGYKSRTRTDFPSEVANFNIEFLFVLKWSYLCMTQDASLDFVVSGIFVWQAGVDPVQWKVSNYNNTLCTQQSHIPRVTVTTIRLPGEVCKQPPKYLSSNQEC